MSRQHHKLKTATKPYQEVEKGNKTFEVRKNDRDFKVYDYIYLQETVGAIFTGREIGPLEIVFVLYDFDSLGIKEGYCVLQLKALADYQIKI